MSRAKLSRDPKRQLGQFFTPPPIAKAIVRQLKVLPNERILEPSLGRGAFMFALVDALSEQLTPKGLTDWAHTHLHGCEIDEQTMKDFVQLWHARGLGPLPPNMVQEDFFRWLPPNFDKNVALNRRLYFGSRLEYFDLIIGNPPFGGSIDPSIQDELDQIFGIRNGMKIKKETYAFFLLKCLDLLKLNGRLCFICSDTILTISTMRGLRYHLQEQCEIEVASVPGQFEETNQNLVLISLVKRDRKPSRIRVFGEYTRVGDVEATPNLSWRVNGEFARYFGGGILGDIFVASSGMTVGNNALFLRKISDGVIKEPYEFSFGQEPITLEGETERARLGKLSPSKKLAIRQQEQIGDARRIIRWELREMPLTKRIPNKDYCFYNKATSAVIYAKPQWVIFWRDNGEYVYTFKKSGKWYLHGVGGKPYFGKEGITWSLIAPRLYTRWLPPGYILDSGAPCAFLKPGVEHDELFFVMGWTLTDLCTLILKNVINHTRNIQSKDFERLPYPYWVSSRDKENAISLTQELLRQARSGKQFTANHPSVMRLNEFYQYNQHSYGGVRRHKSPSVQIDML